jgi:hypothetical protein
MWASAKARAAKAGVPFEIAYTDIVIPSHCPVLGMPLLQQLGKKGGGPCSPSLDRIIPHKGYVWGNIIVVSNRANRLKNDATPEEMQALADFYSYQIRTFTPRPNKRAIARKDPA